MLRIVFVTCCISLFMGFVGNSPSSQNPSPGDFLNLKINQDLTTELQNEEQIAVNPLNGQNLVAVWRDWRLGFRQVGLGASFDGGLTWTEGLLVEPRFTRQSDPGLTYDADGNFYVVVVSYEAFGDSNSLAVFKTTDGGLTWGSPSYAVVSGPESFEDKELIACDRTDNPTRGNLYISWTRFDSGFNTDILFIRSTDGGVSWSSPVQVSDVQGVQWSVPAVGANGEIYVAWVDYSSSNILLDKSTDGGMTFGVDIPIAPVNFLGNINGGILVFPFPALDVDISGGPLNGNLYVAYMWDSGTDMDLFFRRSTDQGTTWSSAARVNDDPFGNGADQFHPWLTVDQNVT
ncbi:exo-alpha-sialidase, partial [candidate division TA06 bacterium]|nr:exo-alpha-sialidase [candidate division TA06 bacterium]